MESMRRARRAGARGGSARARTPRTTLGKPGDAKNLLLLLLFSYTLQSSSSTTRVATMNGLVQHVGYTLYLSGPMPLLGPGADVGRPHGFTRGRAYSLGAFRNYGGVHRPGLLAECRARGLTDTGTVADLKARLTKQEMHEKLLHRGCSAR